jgi:hypothetical protein
MNVQSIFLLVVRASSLATHTKLAIGGAGTTKALIEILPLIANYQLLIMIENINS